MGRSGPVPMNRLWKSHETEWEALEKQFQDVRGSLLSLVLESRCSHTPPLSRIWARLTLQSKRVLTWAGPACCHLISHILHGRTAWSPVWEVPWNLSWQISNRPQSWTDVPVWKQCGRPAGLEQQQLVTRKERWHFRRPVQLKYWGKNLTVVPPTRYSQIQARHST